jgi:hypothetical protein
MDNNLKINYLNLVTNIEFQSYLDLELLKEISMVSKLMREKLKPILFKNLRLCLESIKFESNVISIAYENQYNFQEYDYSALREENNGSIKESLNEYIIALSDIKKFTKSFYFEYNSNAGYYLYPLIKIFDNLTELNIRLCHFPFDKFINIGKTLPNLCRLELESVELVKSTSDIISESNIIFPPNLSYLRLFLIYITTSTLLSDPYEHLFNTNAYPTSYECLTLPKISIPTLKRIDFQPKGQQSHGLEEFLDINPNVESLYTRDYYLNISSNLNSLKSLDNDDLLILNYTDYTFNLSSINSLKFSTTNFNYSENIKRLCQLCPNLVNLNIRFFGKTPDFQAIIDNYLLPILSKLKHLKALALIDIHIDMNGQILDFTKFSKIEKLKIQLMWGSAFNIKFDNCKSLKQFELISYDDNFVDDFKKKANQYNNWVFKFSECSIKGYKI